MCTQDFAFTNFKIADSDDMYELLKDRVNGVMVRIASAIDNGTELLVDYALAVNDIRQ